MKMILGGLLLCFLASLGWGTSFFSLTSSILAWGIIIVGVGLFLTGQFFTGATMYLAGNVVGALDANGISISLFLIGVTLILIGVSAFLRRKALPHV